MNSTRTGWVWTDKAEIVNRNAKAGELVWADFRQCVPVSWAENGYVREAKPNENN